MWVVSLTLRTVYLRERAAGAYYQAIYKKLKGVEISKYLTYLSCELLLYLQVLIYLNPLLVAETI